MKKRGLSEVVSVVLIILLVIAAVVIVWTFVRQAIEQAGEGIPGAADCLQMETIVVENGCRYTADGDGDGTADDPKLDVTVKLNRGEPDGLVIVVDDGVNSNTKIIDSSEVVGLFATKLYSLDSGELSGLDFSTVSDVKVRVAGKAGEDRTCDPGPDVACS